jgi:hypothetical protein
MAMTKISGIFRLSGLNMCRLYFLIILEVVINASLLTAQIINVRDFGAIPDDGKNDRAAIQAAIKHCQVKGATTLIFPEGTYDIIDKAAICLMNDIMDGKLGQNPQDVVYTPYYPYSKGLDFSGVINLEVRAQGANLLCHGWMEPVSMEHCENVTINGLSIDYKTIPHSEGMVVKQTNRYIDIEFEDNQWLKDDMLITRIMFWDVKKDFLLGRSVYHPKRKEKMDDKTLRVYLKSNHEILGTIALMNHTMHFRPAILIHEANNTVLKNVTIHSQPGMGIVGHRSHNVLMEGLKVIPAAGKFQSTNTDATHFTSCTGVIRFDACEFRGQGDDATNVHGYYHAITNDLGENRYEMKLNERHCTHACVLDFPDAGNRIEVINRKTLEVMKTLEVIKVDTFPNQWRSEVLLNGSVPGDIRDFYFIDITRLPKLEFVNCKVESHLARAVLVKTRDVLIENNTFFGGTGTAIHIGAEGDWCEGPGSEAVVVRNNTITACGRGDGTNDGACAVAINVKAADKSIPGIHKNIVIENNIIEGDDAYVGISVQGAEDVEIRNNQIAGCYKNVDVKYSVNVKIQE